MAAASNPIGSGSSNQSSTDSSDTEYLKEDISKYIKILYPAEILGGICVVEVPSDIDNLTDEKIIKFVKDSFSDFKGEVFKMLNKPHGKKIGSIRLNI